ncbi:MAG: hypothetical protein FJX02_03225 [Alphaproteobacteria bacterium]|nr:hypothetical protein [Alphaproteobacteria bacterium]
MPRVARRWLAVGVNLGAAGLAVLAFALWRSASMPTQESVTGGGVEHNFAGPHPELGYAPLPERRVTARRTEGDRVIYDVSYTIDRHGLRATPARDPAAGPPEACIALFGDSITFGEGVSDEATFAWRLVERSRGRVVAGNFAFSGYGPHHALAQLQAGRVAATLDCVPTHAIYLFIPEHIARVAGRMFWDRQGPRYRIGPDGFVRRDGSFDGPGPSAAAVPDLDEGLLGWRRWLRGASRTGGADEAALAVAVLATLRRDLGVLAPGIAFHTILWNPYEDRRTREVAAGLAGAGIPTLRLRDILPEFLVDRTPWVLSPDDWHPNAVAHDRIATAIATRILARAP